MYTIWTEDIKDQEKKKEVQATLKASTILIDRTLRIVEERLKSLDVDNTSVNLSDASAIIQLVGERRAWLQIKKLFNSLKD